MNRYAFTAEFKGGVTIIGECMGIDKPHAEEHAHIQLLDTHPGLWPMYLITIK